MARRASDTQRLFAKASVALFCAALSMSTSERAARADASLSDKAAAQTLFDEGRKLIALDRFAEACPKLAESQKLDPGVGTQFHLADCYERLGQTASAWAVFLDAAGAAKTMGQSDRERVARDRAAALAPRLSKLTIVSPESGALPGLEIKRDGTVVGRALWGTALPVDPGSHVVEATAPGKKPWQTTAQVAVEKAVVVVTIPALEDAPAGNLAARQADATTGVDVAAAGKSRRRLGAIVAGAGVVGLGVGTVFALRAKSKYDESLRSCTPADKNKCDAQGVSLRDDARGAGTIATIAVGVGGAALVAGAVLFFTAPSSSEQPHAALVPTAGPSTVGLAFVGAY
jgi:tetratricopeptide (TPR) repeat protein